MTARRRLVAGGKRRIGRRAAIPSRREGDAGTGAHAAARGGSSGDFNGGLIKDAGIAAAADNERLSCINLLHQAMAVAAAADAYSARGRSNISARTLQFLLSRSLELALKAYLIERDCPEDKLRGFGQDLSMLLEQATAHSFELRSGTTDADRQAVAAVSANYIRKMFEYPRVVAYPMVASRVLRDIVHRAITTVFVAIWKEDPIRINLRRAADRALGLCIADDACYEEFPAAAGENPETAAIL